MLTDRLECAGASVASRRCRADAGCPVQGEGKMPLSRANFVRAAGGSGSAAPGYHLSCGPVRRGPRKKIVRVKLFSSRSSIY